jgi:hypothetical protein
VLATTSLVALLAGCATESPTAGINTTAPSPSTVVGPPSSASTGSARIVLRFGDEFATATLSDTPAAREFAAMLPLQLKLHDPMGQAKSGPLPRPIGAAGGNPVFDPAVGEIYYSAPSGTFAIFYADLGQSIPDPGLVRLGTVDTRTDRSPRPATALRSRSTSLTTSGSDMSTADFPGVRWRGRWVPSDVPEFVIDPTSIGSDLPPAEFSRAQFRRVFDIGDVPPRVPLRLSADSRYVLWVNGAEVGRVRSGPSRAGCGMTSTTSRRICGQGPMSWRCW